MKQVAGPEQPQEEVQLTELLPVKQSCIRENVLKDGDATDALRALRSLSSDCNDKHDEDFDLPEFSICKDVEQQPERRSGKHRRVQNIRRKRTQGENAGCNVDDADSDDEGKRAAGRNAKKTRVNRRRKIPKKKPARSKKQKKDDRRESDGSSEKGGFRLKVPFDDDEFAPDYDEENDEELDKKDCFKDEVYVYRQEPLELSLNSAPKELIGQQRVFCDQNRSMGGNVCNETVSQKSSFDPGDNVTIKDDVKRKCEFNADGTAEQETNNSKRKTENSEEKLRQKIDAIIQANYLLERENNNVVSSSEPKTSDASPSANAADNSSCPLTAMKKKMDQIRTKDSERHANLSKKYRCVVCDARFKGSGGLRNHYKVLHEAGPVFKCDECGKEFPLKERLKLHVRTHTGFKPYKCPECDKSFARGGQLVQHRRTHSQVKPYRCGICSNSFTCAANLSLHVKRHNGQKDHKCELCGRAFVRRDALKKHLECLHRDVKSFVCVICNKTFKGHLPQHMRTHARDRPHGCATCGQRFAQKSQLTVHQRTHSGQRPFRCLVCWQAFAHSTALKLHTRRHTGERPFKCTECNAGFTQLPHWKKHMKCIHGRQDPYGCQRCQSYFRIKSDLENHEKICHPELGEEETDAGGNGGGGGSGGGGGGSGGGGGGGDDGAGTSTGAEVVEKHSVTAKHKLMTVEKMRLLLAVLLQRISKQEKLDELGFGKRLIDDVLQDSLVSAGKEPVTSNGLSEFETLTRNLEIFLEWTMPKEHWENFRRMKKTAEEILEALTDAE